MPYENYDNIEEFHDKCDYWGSIEKRVNEHFSPNYWVFDRGYRPYPQQKLYYVHYRNFIDSRRLTVSFNANNGKIEFKATVHDD